jgi:hypothetical protein
VTLDELYDKIDAWHGNEDYPGPLHEYLGWTWGEYRHWVQTGKTPS